MQLKQIVVAKLSAFLNSGPKPPRSKILAASAIRRGGPGEDDGERDGEVKPRGGCGRERRGGGIDSGGEVRVQGSATPAGLGLGLLCIR